MDLTELIQEINYQEKYTAEKRVDLFNKYFVPTHLGFFNPIYELGKFILDKRSHYKTDYSEYFQDGQYSCYSHCGAVASSFNNEFKEGKADAVKLYKTGLIRIKGYDRDLSKHINLIAFNTDKTITIYKPTTIPRNLYTLIDEWLIDFGYEKW